MGLQLAGEDIVSTTTLRGHVSDLTVERVETGYGEYGGFGHRTKMKVGGRLVSYESPGRPAICDGDEVVVSGRDGPVAFVAIAYRNLSAGIEGNEGLFGTCGLSVVALVLCAGALSQGSFLALVFGAFAAYACLRAGRIFEAIDAIEKAASTG